MGIKKKGNTQKLGPGTPLIYALLWVWLFAAIMLCADGLAWDNGMTSIQRDGLVLGGLFPAFYGATFSVLFMMWMLGHATSERTSDKITDHKEGQYGQETNSNRGQ